MPLWFLAAYLAAQLNLPWLAALHARAPWLTLAGLTALVVAVDCLRGVLPLLAYLNMVFLWCAVQQLGFLVADGRPLRPGRPALLGIMVASNVLLGLLVLLGLYSGNMLVNLNPPNVTLLLLGISQAAAFQLFRPLLERIANLAGVRRVVGVAGQRSMTVYLWHLPLLAAMSGLLLLTDFPQPAGGSAAWWWGRPLVLMGVIALLLPGSGVVRQAGGASDGVRARAEPAGGRRAAGRRRRLCPGGPRRIQRAHARAAGRRRGLLRARRGAAGTDSGPAHSTG